MNQGRTKSKVQLEAAFMHGAEQAQWSAPLVTHRRKCSKLVLLAKLREVMLESLRHLVNSILAVPGVRHTLHLVRNKLKPTDPSNKFLKRASGVIHIGASTGQERTLYAKYGLRVVWIEPIPEVFETLKINLTNYPRQTAFRSLVTDKDGVDYAFHVSTNGGMSSSILEMKLHREIWPNVVCDRTIPLKSTTHESLLYKERIALDDYDALVLDTQGSELLVLQGAAPLLPLLNFIKTEVTDFESYAGCCQLKDVDLFLGEHGFKEIYRRKYFQRHPSGGSYYDVVYQNSKTLRR
jgi:FkbM family methyltransferase